MGLLSTAGVSAAAVCALAVWWAQSSMASSTSLFTPTPGSLQGKTIVITGGTTGLGLESAKRLAMGGAEIVITSRSDVKGQAAVKDILEHVVQQHQQEEGVPHLIPIVSYRLLDMDNLAQVKQECAAWKDLPKIDVLMNNAGVMAMSNRELTVDGYERQIQSNHLGHFVLTQLLLPKLTPAARIINVSSTAHKIASASGLDLDYFWKGEPGYGAWKSYGQSKLANLLFTQELQRRIDSAGLGYTTVSLHPGAVNTDLARNLMGEKNYEKMKSGKGTFVQNALGRAMSLFLKTPEQGASTQIWLASGMGGDNVAAKHFVDCKEKGLAAFATDETAAKKLWAESEENSGVEFTLQPGAAAELVQ
jgi:NAD(P)-dependent dehydrogenase (short-subunit alcohol dehydrogenase family)